MKILPASSDQDLHCFNSAFQLQYMLIARILQAHWIKNGEE